MLSIIIPVLNEGGFINQVLENLVSQSFKKFEVILVDGNSTDNSLKIIKSYLKKLDLRILNSKTRNVSYQRNLGAKNAKNERILFLDADCSFDNQFIEDSLQEISARKIEVSGARLYPDSNNLIDIIFYGGFRIFMVIFHSFIGLNGGCIFTLKELHNKIHGFDEEIKVGEDYDYTCRLKKYTKLKMLHTKIKTSTRRFHKNGRLRTGLKVVFMGFYILIFGKIKNNLFNYRFNE